MRTALSKDSWRVWRFPFEPVGPGPFAIVARATVGEGDVQVQQVALLPPDGAGGHDEVAIGP